MMVHLPCPYDDELLYSVIARYLVRTGSKSAYSTVNNLFGRRSYAQVIFTGSLNTLASQTWPIWRMTGKEIANRLTLFPYYSRFSSRETREISLQMLLSGKRSPHQKLGLLSQRIKLEKFLRFCPHCRESDLDKHGETYWRRSHQLPGVLVCPEHGRPLVNSTAFMHPKSMFDYKDATLCTVDIVVEHGDFFNNDDGALMLKIAKFSQNLLFEPFKQYDAEIIKKSLRQAAIARGFTGDTRTPGLSLFKIRSAFISFYGNSLLSKFNCLLDPNKRDTWPDKLFRVGKKYLGFHPLEHTLLRILFESTPIKQSNEVVFGSGPLRCPNPYANHTEQFPIKKPLNIFISEKGNITATVRCSCGFHFTYNRTTANDPYLPIVNRIIAHGPTWVTEAKRLKKSGLGVSRISQKMGTNYYSILRLLDSKQNAFYVSEEHIAKWRAEWLKLLDSVPDGKVSTARKMNETLHNRLRKHDRGWLSKRPKTKPRKYVHTKQIDWKIRDNDLSEILKSVASRMMQATPMKRVTRTAIIKEAGFSTSLFTKADRLHQCYSILQNLSESLDQYYKRRRLANQPIKRPFNKNEKNMNEFDEKC